MSNEIVNDLVGIMDELTSKDILEDMVNVIDEILFKPPVQEEVAQEPQPEPTPTQPEPEPEAPARTFEEPPAPAPIHVDTYVPSPPFVNPPPIQQGIISKPGTLCSNKQEDGKDNHAIINETRPNTHQVCEDTTTS
jgi:hypothetical protein